jgi:hypothetical protein
LLLDCVSAPEIAREGAFVSKTKPYEKALSPSVRFLLFSNELPHPDDPSATLSSRLVIIQLTESSFGKEDPDLEKNLERERPPSSGAYSAPVHDFLKEEYIFG